jgi:hypothetical protein
MIYNKIPQSLILVQRSGRHRGEAWRDKQMELEVELEVRDFGNNVSQVIFSSGHCLLVLNIGCFRRSLLQQKPSSSLFDSF